MLCPPSRASGLRDLRDADLYTRHVLAKRRVSEPAPAGNSRQGQVVMAGPQWFRPCRGPAAV